MDPFVVLDDANLQVAADAATRGCFSYAGQVCTVSKRLLVNNPVEDEFVKLFAERIKKLRVGESSPAQYRRRARNQQGRRK